MVNKKMKNLLLSICLILPMIALANTSHCNIVSLGAPTVIFQYPTIDTNPVISNDVKLQALSWLSKTRKQSRTVNGLATIYRCDDKVFSAAINVDYDVDVKSGKPYAHPFNDLLIFNYDIKQQKKLQLADLFYAKVNYLAEISKYTYNNLQKKFAAEIKGQPELIGMLKTGTMPKVENFNNFVITPKGITIIFPYYQVGPRYFGQPKVLIPYSALNKIIRSGFVD
jgi:hypothetical protein